MNSLNHIERAETLISGLRGVHTPRGSDQVANTLAMAQVHATIALALVQAESRIDMVCRHEDTATPLDRSWATRINDGEPL